MTRKRRVTRNLGEMDYAFVFKVDGGLEFIPPQLSFKDWPTGYRMFLGSVLRGLHDVDFAKENAEWIEQNHQKFSELLNNEPQKDGPD